LSKGQVDSWFLAGLVLWDFVDVVHLQVISHHQDIAALQGPPVAFVVLGFVSHAKVACGPKRHRNECGAFGYAGIVVCVPSYTVLSIPVQLANECIKGLASERFCDFF
jgi:hypothetical protein